MHFADGTQGTVIERRRLHQAVDAGPKESKVAHAGEVAAMLDSVDKHHERTRPRSFGNDK